jgi:hypothetical protein
MAHRHSKASWADEGVRPHMSPFRHTVGAQNAAPDSLQDGGATYRGIGSVQDFGGGTDLDALSHSANFQSNVQSQLLSDFQMEVLRDWREARRTVLTS